MSEFKKVKKYNIGENGDTLLSQWTSSQTVEMNNGETLENTIDEIKSDLNTHTHNDIYYTESEIDTKLKEKLDISFKGSANGLAELDENGKVLSSQLPSYVDDVLEYDDKSSFPSNGETAKIYVDTSTNLTYRWSGSAYIEISPSLALGETSSTAYRGDRGKIAYDHSQTAHNYAGSSSEGGSATSAVKLDTSAGSATQPVYFNDGKPVECEYVLEQSVTKESKLTDTLYEHPETSGYKHIPSGGSEGQILKWIKEGTAGWVNGDALVENRVIDYREANIFSFNQETSSVVYDKCYLDLVEGKLYFDVTANFTSALTGNNITITIEDSDLYYDTEDGSYSISWYGNNSGAGNFKLSTNSTMDIAGGSGATYTTHRWIGYYTVVENQTFGGEYTAYDYVTKINNGELPVAGIHLLGAVKTTSGVTSTSGYTACPIISGVPYYKNTDTTYTLDTITGTLAVAKGGTGATTAANARTNLGLGTAATYAATTSIASGGTGLITSGAVYTALAGKADTHSHPYLSTSSGGTVAGNVIIGASNVTKTLTVYGGLTVTGNSKLADVYHNSYSGGNSKIIWTSTSPQTLCGTGYNRLLFGNKITGYCTELRGTAVYFNSDTYTFSNKAYATTSDARLKTDSTILDSNSDLTSKYINTWDNMKPRVYSMTDEEEGKYHLGYYAQELEEALYKAGLTNEDFQGLIKISDFMKDSDDVNEGEYFDNLYTLSYQECAMLTDIKLRQVVNEIIPEMQRKHNKEISELRNIIETLQNEINNMKGENI